MIERRVIFAFAALAQETRLRIVRLLVRAGEAGVAAGKIATAVGVSASNVSHHLSQLENAGLIAQRREARSIIYTADYGTLGALIEFLMKDCCGGRPEICAPAISAASCAPATAKETIDG
jgi:ArsR family transcriptional regulator